MIETYGTCIYCGQSQVIRVPEDADGTLKIEKETKRIEVKEA